MFVSSMQRRWSDLDALGHVNNAQYLVYLEQARVEFLGAAADAGVSRDGIGLLVARNEIDYRMPMPYGTEAIGIRTWIDRVGSTSFTFAYEVTEGDAVYARARTVVVCVDEAGRPTPVPSALRKYLEGFTK